MKRKQRSGSNNNTEQAGENEGQKKVKKAVEDHKEIIDGGDVAVFTVENWYGMEELGWLGGCGCDGAAMDELMSWGCFWSPFWGVDFVDSAYTDFFGDVVWDEDIWNLKNIVEIPKP